MAALFGLDTVYVPGPGVSLFFSSAGRGNLPILRRTYIGVASDSTSFGEYEPGPGTAVVFDKPGLIAFPNEI